VVKPPVPDQLITDQRGLREGYRSGLEEKVAGELKALGIPFLFEKVKIKFEQPAKQRSYTPDFTFSNGVIVETKGRLTTADRQKHLWIKAQYPDLDIRFCFSNPQTRIAKGSPTTYALWCDRNGFKYSRGSIPTAWLPKK
jgi:hypothetical protein